jgi:hypothetical protein
MRKPTDLKLGDRIHAEGIGYLTVTDVFLDPAEDERADMWRSGAPVTTPMRRCRAPS